MTFGLRVFVCKRLRRIIVVGIQDFIFFKFEGKAHVWAFFCFK